MTVELVTVVEIDFPKCSRTWGSSPCTAVLSAATPRKCFRSRATCAARAAYDGSETLTLRFAFNQAGLPGGVTIFPTLMDLSVSPAQVNLSGLETGMSAIGRRELVSMTIADCTYHDTLTDPYQAERISGAAQYSGIGYNPADQGTLLGRLEARYPYPYDLPVRVLRGVAGDSLAAMSVTHYRLAKWGGLTADGKLRIEARDILSSLADEKALCPKASSGQLLSAISATDTMATLTPTGIGATYATSGRVSIGREIAGFTRAGDVLTLYRAQEGTSAIAHDALDTVQQCYVVTNTRADLVLADLALNFGGLPSSAVNTGVWAAEAETWLAAAPLTTTIPKPVGVLTLMGEICQLGMMVWPSDDGSELILRANRPLTPDEGPVYLDDAGNFLRTSMSAAPDDEKRLTSLTFLHGMIDPTGSATEPANFRRAAIAFDQDNPYGDTKIVRICTRWLGAIGDDVAAQVIADRLQSRYARTPTLFKAALDRKDVDDVQLGQILKVTSRVKQDDVGLPLQMSMQVNSRKPGPSVIEITAETWTFDARFGFILADGTPDYDAATDDDRANGLFLIDETVSTTFPDGTGPYLMF